MADIELLAGIKGGGSLGGESARNIKEQLDNIIKGLSVGPIEIDVKLNEKSVSTVEKQLKEISSAAQAGADKVKAAYKGIKIGSGTGIAGDGDSKVLTKGVDGYRTAVEKVVSTLKTARANAKKWTAAQGDAEVGDQYSNILKQIDAMEKLQTMLMEGKLTAKQFSEQFDEIKVSLAGSYETINRHGKDMKKVTEGDELKKYKQQLVEVNTLLEKVEQNLNDWSRASGDSGVSGEAYKDLEGYASRLRELQKELLSTGVASESVAEELKQLAANSKTAETKIDPFYKSMTFGTKMLTVVDQLAASFGTLDAFYKIVQIGGDMVDAVTQIDTAMTELRKVTDARESEYASFLEDASQRAQDYGTTVADIVSATADFARLGHSIRDASALADVATIYKNVGDGIGDIDTASSSIISTMQAFGIEAKNAMSIVDSFNAVGNKYAISSAGIGEALLNSASALSSSGNDIHESIALIAAANEVIQDPGRVGTAMKTMSMYLRAAKTEAEEAGIDTTGMAESVSELREEILLLTGQKVDIMLNANTGEYKSTVQILRELANEWKNLSGTTRTNITELIGGGVRNANVISALMSNFDKVESIINTSKNSQGSAMLENEKYLDSIEGKAAKVSASFETLSTKVMDSDMIKGFYDAANIGLQGLSAAADVLGQKHVSSIFLSLLGGSAISNAVKAFSDLTGTAEKLKSIGGPVTKTIGKMFESISKFSSGTDGKGFGEAISGLWSSMKGGLIAGGAIAAAVIAVDLLRISYEKLFKASEKAVEKHDEILSSYEETSDEVESLEDKLASYEDRLRSLNKIESPTLANKEEIADLEKSIYLLNLQLKIKKDLQAYEAQEAADAAYTALTTKSMYATGEYITMPEGNITPVYGYRDIVEEAESYKEEIVDINKQISDAYTVLDNISDKGSKEYKDQEEYIDRLENKKAELEKTFAIKQATLSTLLESLLLGGKIPDGAESIIPRVEVLLTFTADEESAVSATQSAAERAIAAAKKSFKSFMDDDTSTKIDTFQTKVSDLSGVLTSLRDGTMDASGVIDFMQQFPEFAPYVDMTAENFGGLGAAIEKAVRSDAGKLIDSLQKMKDSGNYTERAKSAIDALCDSIGDISSASVQDISGEFGILAEAINSAKIAKNELDAALQEEEYDAGYDARVKAFSGMQEVMDAGEYGSKAFAAYKEYFGLAGESSADVQAWMDANKQYFAEGTEGLSAFLRTVEEMNQSGALSESIASFDSATGELRYDINYLDEFAGELGWTTEMLRDFIDKYRMYCENWIERTDEVNQTEFLEAGIIKETSDGAIASLKDLEAYTHLSSVEAAGLINRINDLRKAEGMEPIQIIGRDQVQISQAMLDSITSVCATAEEAQAAIVDLGNTKGVSFDEGITYNGKNVEEILANGIDASDVVSVDIEMSVNNEEVIQTVTTTAATIESILGQDWEIKLNSDDATTKNEAMQTLLANLTEGNFIVTVNGETSAASTALSDISSQIDEIIAKSSITISVSSTSSVDGETLPGFAAGTKRAPAGPALLGDEYSTSGAPKPELVVTKGHAYIAGLNGPEIGYLNEGDVVFTADQTKKILNGVSGNSVRSIIPRFRTGLNNNALYDAIVEGYGLERKQSGKPGLPPLQTDIFIEPASGNPNGGNGGGGHDGNSAAEVKKTFEELYKEHQHLVAMEQETDAEYLAWLEKAYQDAYKAGEIELDDYRKYAEEVYELQKELFQDSLSDIEHRISILERESGTESQVIELYLQMIQMIDGEMKKARDRGLDDNSDYIQELQDQYYSYQDAIKDIQEEITDDAKSAVEDLIDYRIDMLKQDLENERDALNDKLKDLKKFYDEQKDLLRDAYDEERYLEEQAEKQKTKDDIKAELAKLEFDDSAWAQKRKLELQEELAEAEKDLNDFEKEHAIESAEDLLDEIYERQEEQIESQIESIEEALNDPEALYNQALRDIQNNTLALYEEMVEYNNQYGSGNPEDVKEMWDEAKASLDEFLATFGEAYKNIILVASPGSNTGYASGTSRATPGLHAIDEKGDEYIFQSADGTRYRMFSGGEKVLNAKATNFLYDFATTGGAVLTNMIDSLLRSLNFGGVSPVTQALQLSTGDIIIQGNADQRTVSEIRRAQRENIDYVLREFKRLNR